MRGFNNSTPGDNGRRNIVRYDTPEFNGFSVATSFGEDDIWDAALIYKGTLGDFTVNGRAGYGRSSDGVVYGLPYGANAREPCRLRMVGRAGLHSAYADGSFRLCRLGRAERQFARR